MMGAGNDWPPPKPRPERKPGPLADLCGFALVAYSNGQIHALCRHGACSQSVWWDSRNGTPAALLEQHRATHRPKRRKVRER